MTPLSKFLIDFELNAELLSLPAAPVIPADEQRNQLQVPSPLPSLDPRLGSREEEYFYPDEF